MIRQKRLPLQRVSLNQSLNLNSGAFLQNWPPVRRQSECQLPNDKPSSQVETKQRTGLAQLSNNCNLYQAKEALNIFSQSPCLLLQDHKYSAGRQKGKQNLFGRIAELIKGEEVGMAPCHSNRSKQLAQQDRPYTSLSSRTRLSLDPALQKCHVVLHLTPSEDAPQQQRTSTSRALMNFSKVFRNVSNDRFKVKKDRSLMPRVVQLSAQKIVFHQKERKEKKEMPERPPSRPLTQRRKTSVKAGRYEDEDEEFQIEGWDYFE